MSAYKFSAVQEQYIKDLISFETNFKKPNVEVPELADHGIFSGPFNSGVVKCMFEMVRRSRKRKIKQFNMEKVVRKAAKKSSLNEDLTGELLSFLLDSPTQLTSPKIRRNMTDEEKKKSPEVNTTLYLADNKRGYKYIKQMVKETFSTRKKKDNYLKVLWVSNNVQFRKATVDNWRKAKKYDIVVMTQSLWGDHMKHNSGLAGYEADIRHVIKRVIWGKKDDTKWWNYVAPEARFVWVRAKTNYLNAISCSASGLKNFPLAQAGSNKLWHTDNEMFSFNLNKTAPNFEKYCIRLESDKSYRIKQRLLTRVKCTYGQLQSIIQFTEDMEPSITDRYWLIATDSHTHKNAKKYISDNLLYKVSSKMPFNKEKFMETGKRVLVVDWKNVVKHHDTIFDFVTDVILDSHENIPLKGPSNTWQYNVLQCCMGETRPNDSLIRVTQFANATSDLNILRTNKAIYGNPGMFTGHSITFE